MGNVSGSVAQFELQRRARAELLANFTLLLGAPAEQRAAKLCFIEAAKEYCAADAELDAHRNRAARSFLRRREERAQLATCLAMVAGERDVSDHTLDLLIQHFGRFLMSESVD
jgi:hypothetical protein